MFMGEYNHTVDPKGRLIVPSKFREQLGSEFVVTKGLDGCLFVYPAEEWHNIEDKFRNISMTSKDARKFSRFFFAGAAAVELDKQGRICLLYTSFPLRRGGGTVCGTVFDCHAADIAHVPSGKEGSEVLMDIRLEPRTAAHPKREEIERLHETMKKRELGRKRRRLWLSLIHIYHRSA